MKRSLLIALTSLTATSLMQAKQCLHVALLAFKEGSRNLNEKTNDALKLAFPDASTFEKHTKIADSEAYTKIKELLPDNNRPSRFYKYYEAKDSDNRVLGYASIDNVIGKHDYITYLIAFNTNLSVKQVEILVYREAYGFEIQRDSWRKQFHGKKISDKLKLRSTIPNISGATLSCRAMINAVREHLVYINNILNKTETNSHSDRTVSLKPLKSQTNLSHECTPYTRIQIHMGTLLEIQAYSMDRYSFEMASNAAFSEVSRIERKLSRFIPGSEIGHYNTQISKGVSSSICDILSKESQQLLERADSFKHKTFGAFNITQRDGTLDFGAIGKGYALDRAANILRQHGVFRALLNFGGQVLALDAPPGQEGWHTTVQDPTTGNTAKSYSISNQSIATSALNQRGDHIIDPRIGESARSLIQSATAISSSAEEADAWATALFVNPQLKYENKFII